MWIPPSGFLIIFPIKMAVIRTTVHLPSFPDKTPHFERWKTSSPSNPGLDALGFQSCSGISRRTGDPLHPALTCKRWGPLGHQIILPGNGKIARVSEYYIIVILPSFIVIFTNNNIVIMTVIIIHHSSTIHHVYYFQTTLPSEKKTSTEMAKNFHCHLSLSLRATFQPRSTHHLQLRFC